MRLQCNATTRFNNANPTTVRKYFGHPINRMKSMRRCVCVLLQKKKRIRTNCCQNQSDAQTFYAEIFCFFYLNWRRFLTTFKLPIIFNKILMVTEFWTLQIRLTHVNETRARETTKQTKQRSKRSKRNNETTTATTKIRTKFTFKNFPQRNQNACAACLFRILFSLSQCVSRLQNTFTTAQT